MEATLAAPKAKFLNSKKSWTVVPRQKAPRDLESEPMEAPTRIEDQSGWRRRPRHFTYNQRASLDPSASKPDYLVDTNLFRRSYVCAIGESDGQPLDSTTSWFLGNSAAFYRLVSNSVVEARRTREDAETDGIDSVVFGHVISGQYEVETASGAIVLHPGDLGLVDSTLDMTTRSRFVHLASIRIPRIRIVESIGNDLLQSSFHLRLLTDAPLAPFARAQMRLLSEVYGQISAEEFEIAVEATAEILLDIVHQELRREAAAEARPDGLFAEALIFIQDHFRQPSLSPEDVAQAVGVSRARLYALFAENRLTISGYLRDLRLRRFVDALRSTDEAGIGQLAWRCGFGMQAADFARLFKRVYGMTPRAARATLRGDKHVLPPGDQ